jgi:hypothetical protein
MHTEIGVFRYVTRRLCHRGFLANYNDDQTSNGELITGFSLSSQSTLFTPALDFTNEFCCDSEEHGNNFDINRYFLAVLLRSDSSTIAIAPADASKPPRMKY